MSEEFPAAEMHRGIRSMLDKDKRIAELELVSNGLQIKISQLLKLNENLHKISTETGQRIKELEAQVEKMRVALNRIAKLFGENDRHPDDYGKIAREALKEAK